MMILALCGNRGYEGVHARTAACGLRFASVAVERVTIASKWAAVVGCSVVLTVRVERGSDQPLRLIGADCTKQGLSVAGGTMEDFGASILLGGGPALDLRDFDSRSIRNIQSILGASCSSWAPQWMGSIKWIKDVQMPSDFADFFANHIQADMRELADGDESCRVSARKAGSYEMWRGPIAKSRMTTLLSNTVRAIVHSMPWGAKLSNCEREELLVSVVRHFVDAAPDPEACAGATKELMSTVQSESSVQDLQSLYVAFTDDRAWGVDAYRNASNFKSLSDATVFREECDARVQERLHIINRDLSTTEAVLCESADQWAAVNQAATCFGGGQHATSTGEEQPNCIRLHVTCIQVVDVNPSTQKHMTLPSRVTVSAAYYHAGLCVDSASMRGKSGAVSGGVLPWVGSACFKISVDDPSGAAVGFENVSTCRLVIDIARGGVGCACGSKLLASVVIPVQSLYDKIAPLHSPLRKNEQGRRLLKGDAEPLGMHFCHRLFIDRDSGVAVEAAVSMECRCAEHNRPPPRVNVTREVTRRQVNVALVPSEAWEEDHHRSAVDLADVLTELTDAELLILSLYCDRFLVHDELRDLLIARNATRFGKIEDDDARELMLASLESLMERRGKLTTYKGEEILEETLELVKKRCLDLILAIEDVCTNPRMTGKIVDASMEVLSRLGCHEQDVEAFVRDGAEEFASFFVGKLTKILYCLNTRQSQRSRSSILVELAKQDSCESLMAKARAFLEVVDNGFHVTTNMVSYGIKSKHPLVKKYAVIRAQICLERVCDQMASVVTSFFRALAQEKDVDPIGDAFGVITRLYERVMELSSLLEGKETLERYCVRLVRPFNDFLPTWFSLCELVVEGWCCAIISTEPLEPIADGTVHCNGAAASAKALLDAVNFVFDKVVFWAIPSALSVYLLSFTKLVANFTERFSDALVEQGERSPTVSEWVVCVSSLVQFGVVMKNFWVECVFGEAFASCDDSDGMLRYQCKSIQAAAFGHLDEAQHRMCNFISGMMRGAVKAILVQGACAHPGSTGDKCLSAFGAAAAVCIRDEFQLIMDNADERTAAQIMRQAARGAQGGLVDYAVHCSSMSPSKMTPHLLEAVDALDEALHVFDNGVLFTEHFLKDLNHKCRTLLPVVALPSSELVALLQSGKVTEGEEALIAQLLRSRGDRTAMRYLNMCRRG